MVRHRCTDNTLPYFFNQGAGSGAIKIHTIMAQVITLTRRNWRNRKGNKGAGRPNHHAVKDKPKPGMFYVDQFADWLMGFKTPDVSYPSRVRVEMIKLSTTKK